MSIDDHASPPPLEAPKLPAVVPKALAKAVSRDLRNLLVWRDSVADDAIVETTYSNRKQWVIGSNNPITFEEMKALAESANYFYRRIGSDARVRAVAPRTFRSWVHSEDGVAHL